MSMNSTIRLDQVAFDAGTQIRAAIDQHVVSDYAEAMTNGATFPPIVLFHDGNQHYLADGFHRFMAAQRLAFREIAADVRAGTKNDALWFALGANRTNGKRLNEADKTHAAEVALRAWPERMQREIAEQVGCSESLVSKVAMRISPETPGVAPELRGRALANKTKREAIAEMVKAGAQSIDIRDALKAHPQVIAEVRREMGLGMDRSRTGVQSRRDHMREMAERGHTSRQIAAELGISEEGCRRTLRAEGIDVSADRAVGKTKRHDANRIVERIVMDAENIIEGVNLIEFDELDAERLPEWIASLSASRDKLMAFIRRLMKERQTHGEAA